MDIITLLIGGAFLVLFAASIRRYLRHRGAIELAVVLVFSSTAGIFALAIVNRMLPAIAPILTPLAVCLLVAQPVLMLRLVGMFVPMSRWAAPLAAVGTLASVVAFFASGRHPAATLFLVGYFAAIESLAAVALIREGRRRYGFPRARLTVAGLASALFGLSILTSGLGAIARGPDAGVTEPAVLAASRLMALLAGLGYLVAFVPPRWLRDIGQRALAFDLVRAIVTAPRGTAPRVRWDALATTASQILGTRRVRILAADGLLAASDTEPAAPGEPQFAAPPPTRTPADASVDIELRSEGRPVAVISAVLEGRPLFIEDDIALLELLGSLTALAIDREEAAAIEQEAATLRASEARFRALLEADPNSILSIGPDGTIRWCTASAAELFGIPWARLIDRRLDEFVGPGNETRTHSDPAGHVVRYETVGRREDGSTFPAEVALSSFEFDGAPSQLAVVTDITWRHQADALRERFIGVLSHELRTPITSIFGGTQVLRERGARLPEATRDELLADVADEAERLQRMIENLLVLARVERGSEVLEVAPVLVHRVLPSVLERERAYWPAMSISMQVDPGLPLVAGDEASLALLMRNLISNAGKYAGPDARVDVSVSTAPAGGVVVRVRDDGPGIDDAESDALFGLYYRSGTDTSVPGSGIGLFVCRQLVAAMGGEIWARSRSEGGSEFGFRLPAWPEDRSDADVVDRPVVAVGA
jgi:PAS domain S-box-containing protein